MKGLTFEQKMYNRLVFLGIFVLCLSIAGKINGDSNDEVKTHGRDYKHHQDIHQKSHHHVHQKSHENHHKGEEKHYFYHALGAHQVRHHKGIKTRQENGSTCSYNICVDDRLAAVATWLNGTRELDFFYWTLSQCDECGRSNGRTNITLPFTPFPLINVTPYPESNITLPYLGNNITLPYLGSNTTLPYPGSNINFSHPGSNITLPPFPWTNVTISNSTKPVNGSSLYPIFSYWARIFGRFLAEEEGLARLFGRTPEFAKIWREILVGLRTGGCNRTDVLIKNLRDLFGCNGTFFGVNLFNFTYWEYILFPWTVSTIEHAGNDVVHNVENWISSWGKK